MAGLDPAVSEDGGVRAREDDPAAVGASVAGRECQPYRVQVPTRAPRNARMKKVPSSRP